MTIPEDVKQKIKDNYAVNKNCPEELKQIHLLAKLFQREGAEYGYSLAQSEIESKEKDHNKVVKALSEKITEQSQEITRLKGLIEKLCESSMPEVDCIKFKKENNL